MSLFINGINSFEAMLKLSNITEDGMFVRNHRYN
jgi:hypothetical protein